MPRNQACIHQCFPCQCPPRVKLFQKYVIQWGLVACGRVGNLQQSATCPATTSSPCRRDWHRSASLRDDSYISIIQAIETIIHTFQNIRGKNYRYRVFRSCDILVEWPQTALLNRWRRLAKRFQPALLPPSGLSQPQKSRRQFPSVSLVTRSRSCFAVFSLL